ncbi:c-type cytochrome [Aestuariibacter sp. AA17]|uniref:C-type cytochrome n=1 Tax=Fluctibacter corallii TaxID=2984329 RepID=A0ABT3A676_9ALTE|nr:c-type cytochrome [Aestuariibacter sp. AA17]MCV2884087.1 c-type cytochrome [Aestuariibacter sp. AA17]
MIKNTIINAAHSAAKHILLLVALNVTTYTFANESDTPPTPYALCVSCHGQEATGNVQLGAPAIAGQHAWYTQRQLHKYKQQIPKPDAYSSQMFGIAAGLSDSDIDALSTYLASLSPHAQTHEQDTVAQAHSPEIHKRGESYYHGKCGACHGGNAQGNAGLKAPNLHILSSQYIRRQMQNFKDGRRGHAEDDRSARQMAMMASRVSNEELDAILVYIATQKPANEVARHD